MKAWYRHLRHRRKKRKKCLYYQIFDEIVTTLAFSFFNIA